MGALKSKVGRQGLKSEGGSHNSWQESTSRSSNAGEHRRYLTPWSRSLALNGAWSKSEPRETVSGRNLGNAPFGLRAFFPFSPELAPQNIPKIRCTSPRTNGRQDIEEPPLHEVDGPCGLLPVLSIDMPVPLQAEIGARKWSKRLHRNPPLRRCIAPTPSEEENNEKEKRRRKERQEEEEEEGKRHTLRGLSILAGLRARHNAMTTTTTTTTTSCEAAHFSSVDFIFFSRSACAATPNKSRRWGSTSALKEVLRDMMIARRD